MPMSKYLVDISILRENPTFRRVLVARGISLVGLGFLSVGIPVHVYALTGSSFNVGLVLTFMSIGLFTGLMLGGTLSDLYDRRKLILFARTLCGLGFLGLYINSIVPNPSVFVIYGLVLWDGFFGALGISGLLGAMVQIVGRDKMAPATALVMIVTRFATIASPGIAGVIIATTDVSWTYAVAAFATLLTVLTLRGLPPLSPQDVARRNPVVMILDALSLVKSDRTLICLFGLGALMSLAPAIRTVFPALAHQSGMDPDIVAGFLYTAVPLGAVIGAMFSRRLSDLEEPGLALSALCCFGAGAMILLGFVHSLPVTFIILVFFGSIVGVVGVVQMSMVQKVTPDSHLGRVNSLYMAQENLGLIFGATVFGFMTTRFAPDHALLIFGGAIMVCILLLRLALPLKLTVQDAGSGI